MNIFCYHNPHYVILHRKNSNNIKKSKIMKKYILELNETQLLQLEVIFENRIYELSRLRLNSKREKDILAKIYEISPTSKKTRIK